MSDSKINILRLGHVVYKHTDLVKLKEFLLDFGMTVTLETQTSLYMRGLSPQPYIYEAHLSDTSSYEGAAFVVDSRADLERAAKLGQVGIEKLEGPGGGEQVKLRDPDGFIVRLVYGQKMIEKMEVPIPIIPNFEEKKPRKGEFLRFECKPAMIHKLGHFGVIVKSFKSSYEWYTSIFNLAPSDIIIDKEGDDGKELGAFLHVDRGEEWTDHHTFFFLEMPDQHVHHCSFEVHDFDTQMLGHKYLEEKGYQLEWGVGRHVLGSQVFDYWRDPVSGFMIEHYCDGDIVNNTHKAGRSLASEEGLAVWGPKLPETFLV
ncbi:trihydroxytoluene oxygenase [Meredithblackwellia eburnea MCA 4105]